MRIFGAAAAVGALALAAALGTTATAQADRGSGGGSDGGGGDNRTVRMEDDCDPATFDAVLGAGACVGDGDTLFADLFAQLAEERTADKWRNHPDETHIDDDEGLLVTNQGGEGHTFTMVAAFGPGCVPEVNGVLGLTGPPAAPCPDSLGGVIPSGRSMSIAAAALTPGMHLFQCMIHPWMQTTLEVRADHHH